MTQVNGRALKMLSTALEMEQKGKLFYDKAIESCGNALGREIFTTLRNDEIVHLSRIKAIYDSLEGGDGWTDLWRKHGEGHERLVPFFAELARKAGPNVRAESSDLDALSVGIEFEQRSVNYYRDELSHATDPTERIFLEKMIAEEQSHFDVLTDMRFYLSDAAAWFAEKERTGFDGV